MMYFKQRSMVPGEEEFSNEMMKRIEQKFNEHALEGKGTIGMESFGIMVSDLDLVTEDDPE